MLNSPYWNRCDGVCTKHWLPAVPCPQCIATQDEDMADRLSQDEQDMAADLEAAENAHEPL